MCMCVVFSHSINLWTVKPKKSFIIPLCNTYCTYISFADFLMKDAVNVNMMDVLSGLDKGSGLSKICYLHLAEHFDVDKEQLLRIQVSTTSHPCECLFFYLTTVKPGICFGDIKTSLKAMEREDILLQMKDIPGGYNILISDII